MRKFPIIEVEATSNFEVGLQYGRQAEEFIKAAVEDYRLLFSETSTMSWDEIRQYAMTYVPVIAEVFPELIEEAKGIAQGAKVDFEDVMVLNCRYEITKFPCPHECTSFAVLPEASLGGLTYVGQNWDYRVGIIDHIVIVHIRMADGLRVLGTAEAGQLIRNGFNSYGLGQNANNLQSIHDSRDVGIPVTFLRRKILTCRSLKEAQDLVFKAKRAVSVNFMLASTEGKAVDLETSPKGVDSIQPVGGILTHANHFVVTPDLNALETSPRGDRLYELLAQKRGSIDVPHIISCLGDHANYPKAICRHPADMSLRLGRRSCTVAGIIYNLTEQVAHICAGAPCESEFVRIEL